MKVKVPADLAAVESFEDLRRYAAIITNALVSEFNGNISVSDNLSVDIQSVTFLSANTNLLIKHGLNRVPVGYWVVQKSAATDVYDGTERNTKTVINLRATIATTVTVLIF